MSLNFALPQAQAGSPEARRPLFHAPYAGIRMEHMARGRTGCARAARGCCEVPWLLDEPLGELGQNVEVDLRASHPGICMEYMAQGGTGCARVARGYSKVCWLLDEPPGEWDGLVIALGSAWPA